MKQVIRKHQLATTHGIYGLSESSTIVEIDLPLFTDVLNVTMEGDKINLWVLSPVNQEDTRTYSFMCLIEGQMEELRQGDRHINCLLVGDDMFHIFAIDIR